MKILAIGDTHGGLKKIMKIPKKDLDLILLTGDLGNANLARKMAFENVERLKKGLDEKEFSSQERKKAFMESYNSSIKVVNYLKKFAPVYTIFGNVESDNKETREYANKIGLELPFLSNRLNNMKDVKVINNRIANFNGVRIGGLKYFIDTSWVRVFKPNDYRESFESAKKETEKAKKVLKWFNNLDILVCHQPPYGILDKAGISAPKHWRGKHAGSKTILDYVKKYHPKFVFCGHMHEEEGKKKVGKSEVYNLGIAGYKIINL